MKLFLNKIISPYQSAFIPDRQILDNITIAYEIIHTMRSKSGKKGANGNLAIKIYMAKDFDRVDWEFLLGIMKKIGFNDQ